MITNDHGDQIEAAMASTRIELAKRAANLDRVYSIRKELDEISGNDLILFADWIYNQEIATVKEFIEGAAREEKENNCGF
jgi:hypothetical protein